MQFIAFDIETTGFLPRVDQMVEIAAVRYSQGKVVNHYSTLINPKISIPKEAMRVHGITDEMVKDKILVEEALEAFANFCGDDILVAHNAPFDVEFIKSDIQKFESKAPKGIILDSCAMARKVIAGSPNYKLGTLVAHLQIRNDGGYHRAEADARYCGELFNVILSKIYKSGESPVIENLVNLSGGQILKFPQIQRSYRQMELSLF